MESGAAADPQPQNTNSSSTELDNLCQRVNRKTFTKAISIAPLAFFLFPTLRVVYLECEGLILIHSRTHEKAKWLHVLSARGPLHNGGRPRNT
jgi:hypothetical protein